MLTITQFGTFCRRLDLSHNFFGDGAAEAIAEGLSQTEALCHIDLSSNFLGIRTCTALGQALLNRSAASKQTLQTVSWISQAKLQPCPFLVSPCPVYFPGAYVKLASLGGQPHPRSHFFPESHLCALQIVLDNNPCTVNGASMIAEFLAKTKSAMSISIQGCSFERAAPKVLQLPSELMRKSKLTRFQTGSELNFWDPPFAACLLAR